MGSKVRHLVPRTLQCSTLAILVCCGPHGDLHFSSEEHQDQGDALTAVDMNFGPDATLSDAAPSDTASTHDLPEDAPTPDSFDCDVEGTLGHCLHVDNCLDGLTSVPGFCPGPAEIQCCVSVSGSSCDPDVRPLPNAGMQEEPGSGDCSSGMIALETFCIDQFEASLVEVLEDGREEAWSPYFPPLSAEVRAVSIAGATPQAYVNAVEAASACQRSGKRLCTDDEWLRACRGMSDRNYPYGNIKMPHTCNDTRDTHPAVDLFGADDPELWSKLGHPCINQQPGTLAQSGRHAGCVSEDGVFDLVGNLHEWTDNEGGVFRGGFYADTERNGSGCNYRTGAHQPAYSDYSTGFRCCQSR
jgi:formylglycine-generating enzyme